ncbi:MAG: malate dehydrogenase [Halothiobacillaceae bacterium]
MPRFRITLFGAGQVGATAAFLMAREGLGDIVLIDNRPGLAAGKAEDIRQSLALTSSPVQVSGGEAPALCVDAGLVIITAGMPRKTGMSREDLLRENLGVLREVVDAVCRHASAAIVLVVSNPVDLLTLAALRTLGWPRHRILGLSGQLDAHRLRRFVADALSVAIEDVQAQVLGPHSDDMLILPRLCTVKGIPMTELLPAPAIAGLVDAVRQAGGRLIAQTGGLSPFFSAAATITELTRTIVRDEHRLVNASVLLEGEYGLHDVCLALPVRLGRTGIQAILPPQLDAKEQEALGQAARRLQALARQTGAMA